MRQTPFALLDPVEEAARAHRVDFDAVEQRAHVESTCGSARSRECPRFPRRCRPGNAASAIPFSRTPRRIRRTRRSCRRTSRGHRGSGVRGRAQLAPVSGVARERPALHERGNRKAGPADPACAHFGLDARLASSPVHLATSARTNDSVSADAMRRLRPLPISKARSARRPSAWPIHLGAQRSTIASGAARGGNRPNQVSISRSTTPVSMSVGSFRHGRRALAARHRQSLDLPGLDVGPGGRGVCRRTDPRGPRADPGTRLRALVRHLDDVDAGEARPMMAAPMYCPVPGPLVPMLSLPRGSPARTRSPPRGSRAQGGSLGPPGRGEKPGGLFKGGGGGGEKKVFLGWGGFF